MTSSIFLCMLFAMNRLVLIKPTFEYQEEIVDMVNEWREYNNSHPEEDHSPWAIFQYNGDFSSYLDFFKQSESNPKPGLVPATTYFALDIKRNRIVGAICIRHYLTEALLNSGGHIGDGIRPSERRKGYATEMIGLALEKCKEMNIDKVMMSCRKNNIGSKKSIMNNGGVYDIDLKEDEEILERYWIDLNK